MTIPFTSPGAWPERAPSRFAARIGQAEIQDCQVALLGLPDDLGIKLNGGRVGARQGPAAFRRALARFGSTWDARLGKPLSTSVFDAGNVEPAPGEDEAALAETHDRVRQAAGALHAAGLVVVCIGGGHDLSFPAITALSRHVAAPLGGVNLDAHLDVRERIGSGMPFRRLIQDKSLDPVRFVEVGIGRYANDEADHEWLSKHGGNVVFAEEVFREGMATERLFGTSFEARAPGFVSIDLDGLDQSAVSGVSAPNPLGLGVWHATKLAEAAGKAPEVRHFDIMELCPPQDVADQSARVAALLFLSFLSGFGEREA